MGVGGEGMDTMGGGGLDTMGGGGGGGAWTRWGCVYLTHNLKSP